MALGGRWPLPALTATQRACLGAMAGGLRWPVLGRVRVSESRGRRPRFAMTTAPGQATARLHEVPSQGGHAWGRSPARDEVDRGGFGGGDCGRDAGRLEAAPVDPPGAALDHSVALLLVPGGDRVVGPGPPVEGRIVAGERAPEVAADALAAGRRVDRQLGEVGALGGRADHGGAAVVAGDVDPLDRSRPEIGPQRAAEGGLDQLRQPGPVDRRQIAVRRHLGAAPDQGAGAAHGEELAQEVEGRGHRNPQRVRHAVDQGARPLEQVPVRVRQGARRQELVELGRQVDDRQRLSAARPHHPAVRAEEDELAGRHRGRQRRQVAVARHQDDGDAAAPRDVGGARRVGGLGEAGQPAGQLGRLLGAHQGEDGGQPELGEELEVDGERVAGHPHHLRVHRDDREALRALGSIQGEVELRLGRSPDAGQEPEDRPVRCAHGRRLRRKTSA